MAIEWKGVLPAVTTNFTADDELDLPMFIRNLLFQVEAGVDGIVIGGSLGEASTLTPEEKEKLVRSAVEALEGRVPVILNIAEGATRDAGAIYQAGGDNGRLWQRACAGAPSEAGGQGKGRCHTDHRTGIGEYACIA